MDSVEKHEDISRGTPAAMPLRPSMAPNPYFRKPADLGTEENAVPEVKPLEEKIPAAPPIAIPVTVRREPAPAPEKKEAPAFVQPEQPKPAAPVKKEVPVYYPPAPAKAHSKPAAKKGGFGKKIIAAVLVLALVAAGCILTADALNRQWETRYQQMNTLYNQQIVQLQTQIDENARESTDLNSTSGQIPVVSGEGTLTPSQVYAQNVPSVVAISCTVRGGYSTGSGFILTENGYVATNYHVVEGALSVEVITHGGTTYAAEVVGYDNTNDLAVLKVDATGLPAVTIGSSDALIVGDQVVAIGNPLGELTNTLTVGYVSAKERDVTTDGVTINMMQTDAAINSGNSGGPLFNMYGQVVGITTAKYSGESSSGATIEGIGFAIPMDDIYPLMEDLMTHGYIKSAYLGVMVKEMNPLTAVANEQPVGAYVVEVTPGYCAEAAGLQVDDIIIALGTYEVGGINDLTRALRNFEAGETTTITVFRDGEELVLTITLDEKPQETKTVPTGNTQMPEEGSYEEWYNYFAPFFGDGE